MVSGRFSIARSLTAAVWAAGSVTVSRTRKGPERGSVLVIVGVVVATSGEPSPKLQREDAMGPAGLADAVASNASVLGAGARP